MHPGSPQRRRAALLVLALALAACGGATPGDLDGRQASDDPPTATEVADGDPQLAPREDQLAPVAEDATARTGRPSGAAGPPTTAGPADDHGGDHLDRLDRVQSDSVGTASDDGTADGLTADGPGAGAADGDPGRAQPGAQPATEPVETLLPEIRVELPADPAARRDAVETAMATTGVTFATLVAVEAVPLALPRGGRAEVLIAAVDPAAFRVLVPQVTADAAALWERVAEGELTLTHEQAEELDLGLEDQLDGPDGPLRLAAIAALGQPPVAHGMVDRALGDRLGIGPARTLLVAVEPRAWPDEVAADLERALGTEATLIYGKPQRRITDLPRETVWDELAMCEASGNWAANTGNGYYGGLQFLPSSWHLVGGTGMPHEASRDEQILRGELLLARQGWRAWPVCSVRLGLRQPGPGDAPDGRPLRP